MAFVRFHILFLITLGFLLGNGTTYANELPSVNQTTTSWVINSFSESSPSTITYTSAISKYTDQKHISSILFLIVNNLQNIKQWHHSQALLRFKEFKKITYHRQHTLSHLYSYVVVEADEAPSNG